MRHYYNKAPFIFKILLAMLLCLLLNFVVDIYLKFSLSQKNYVLALDIDYNNSGTVEFFYDTGSNFNRKQRTFAKIKKGQNKLEIPFSLKEQEQLNHIRLDFGKDTTLTGVRLKRLSLLQKNKTLIDLKEDEILENIILYQKVFVENNNFKIENNKRPYNPYIVFKPVNELMFKLWHRVFLLVIFWLLVFLPKIYASLKKSLKHKEYVIIFATLFLITIPLKPAWVTFSTLLLLSHGIFLGIRKKEIKILPNHLLITFLFFIPLIFIGSGKLYKLAIPLGFVFLPLSCALIDFSIIRQKLQEVYTQLSLILMSMIISSWLLLIIFKGYFYSINIENYFLDLKSNVHQVLYFLYYDHPTFLGFFIVVGAIFCFVLFQQQKVSKTYLIFYAVCAYMTILILGSRFILALSILMPGLLFFSPKILSKILIPLTLIITTTIFFFINDIDVFRSKLWSIATNRIMEKPWFGYGTGNAELVLPKTLPIEKLGTQVDMRINHPHNQIITYLLENGLVATILIFGTLFYIFQRFYLQQNKSMLLVTFSAFLLMVIDSPFKTATPLYGIVFLLAAFSKSLVKPKS